jgi:hypothetical protein
MQPNKKPRLHRHETVVAIATQYTATNKARNEYRGMTTNAPATVPCSPIVMAVGGSLFGDTWCPSSVKLLIAQYAWDVVTCVPKCVHKAMDRHARLYSTCRYYCDARIMYLHTKNEEAFALCDGTFERWLTFLENMSRDLGGCGVMGHDADYDAINF